MIWINEATKTFFSEAPHILLKGMNFSEPLFDLAIKPTSPMGIDGDSSSKTWLNYLQKR